MRDGAAERRAGGRLGIDMDELVILGRVGESVDPGLLNRPANPTRRSSSPTRARMASSEAIGINLSPARCRRSVRHDHRPVRGRRERSLGRIGQLDLFSFKDPKQSGDDGRFVERQRVRLACAIIIDQFAIDCAWTDCGRGTSHQLAALYRCDRSLTISGSRSITSGGRLVDKAEWKPDAPHLAHRRRCESPARAIWCWP